MSLREFRFWQTCRHCHDVVKRREDGFQLGERHWIHWSCITVEYLERKTKEAMRYRAKSEKETSEFFKARLIKKAERVEWLLNKIKGGRS